MPKTKALTQHQKWRRRLSERFLAGEEVPHGSNATYSVGCRCEACCAAASARRARQKASQAERIVRRDRSVRHGTLGTYVRGCRCRRCVAVMSDYGRARTGNPR